MQQQIILRDFEQYKNDAQGLCRYLDSLSNSKFRMASGVLAESYLPTLSDEDFYAHFLSLTQHNAKAFLGTLLKASTGRNLLNEDFLLRLLPILTDVDKQKIVQHHLPLCTTPEEVNAIFRSLHITDSTHIFSLLLMTKTLPASFVLLQQLRYKEEDRRLLMKTASMLMMRGDEVSFNMAALMKALFCLDDLRGTFSLTLEPWELHRMETDYAYFASKIVF